MDAQKLTPRQFEVLSLCAAYPNGTSAELAGRLGVSSSTFRNVLSSAYLRLGVRTRNAAIAQLQTQEVRLLNLLNEI
jgi:DNA-binding CsgD family transcriptional regulator